MAISHIKNPNPTITDMQCSNYRNFYPKIPIYFTDEQWVPITLPNLQPWYYISSYGRVYSKLYDCLIKDRFVGRGYKIITLRDINNKPVDLLIHRLVMLSFNPIQNPENFQVNHIDTDKCNNKLSNLEWCTNSENMIHAYNHDLYYKGEDNNFAVINNDTAIKICEALEQNMSYNDICKYANLPISKRFKDIIYQIKTHKNWKHISKNYNF